jgi:hypothetical protein
MAKYALGFTHRYVTDKHIQQVKDENVVFQVVVLSFATYICFQHGCRWVVRKIQ